MSDSIVRSARLAAARDLYERGASPAEAGEVVGDDLAATLGGMPPASVQAAVMTRSAGLCELCGFGPRAIGGKLLPFTVERIAPATPLADYDDLSNLLWVCGPCVASEMAWRPPADDRLGDAFVTAKVGYGWYCRKCRKNGRVAFRTGEEANAALRLHRARYHG